MHYLGFEQITVSNTALDYDDLTVATGATCAWLQADSQNIRYTMDGSTTPTQSLGLILLTTEPPALFRLSDLKNMKFVRGAGSDAKLNVHYGADVTIVPGE